MINKLSAIVFALALVACVATPAVVQAQDNIGVYFNDAGTLRRYGTTSQTFDVAVVAKCDDGSVAGEFVIRELLVDVPGVFKINTVKINNTPLDLGNNAVGEYLLAYTICVPAGPVELVRVTYFDAGSAVPNDYIIWIRGFQPGDSRPSSFMGVPGYVDCAQHKLPLTLEPWVDGDKIDPTKGPFGVANSDGVAVLNALTTPTVGGSIGAMKARF